jgi:hypothetical protein
MPYEVQNCFVATQMLRYGQVIPESVRRGYIKGTNIENGSRYLQMLKCDKTLPNKTNFGRFEVRIFADNNRTECKYCRRSIWVATKQFWTSYGISLMVTFVIVFSTSKNETDLFLRVNPLIISLSFVSESSTDTMQLFS